MTTTPTDLMNGSSTFELTLEQDVVLWLAEFTPLHNAPTGDAMDIVTATLQQLQQDWPGDDACGGWSVRWRATKAVAESLAGSDLPADTDLVIDAIECAVLACMMTRLTCASDAEWMVHAKAAAERAATLVGTNAVHLTAEQHATL